MVIIGSELLGSGEGLGLLIGSEVGLGVGVGVGEGPKIVIEVGLRERTTLSGWSIAAAAVVGLKAIWVVPGVVPAMRVRRAMVLIPCTGASGELPRTTSAVPGAVVGADKMMGMSERISKSVAVRNSESKLRWISTAETEDWLVSIMTLTENSSPGEKVEFEGRRERVTSRASARVERSWRWRTKRLLMPRALRVRIKATVVLTFLPVILGSLGGRNFFKKLKGFFLETMIVVVFLGFLVNLVLRLEI